MATLVYVGTHGSENPTKAAIPFFLANGAAEEGHEARFTNPREFANLTASATNVVTV